MKQAIIVVDLGFGDAGKGTIVDYLCNSHPSSLVVRYNGGPQAAHNVVTDEGGHHTFHQFGSGTLAKAGPAKTIILPTMCIDPLALMNEADELEGKGVKNPLGLITVDGGCKIVTPFHGVVNRVKERMRNIKTPGSAHGSCGSGVGEMHMSKLFLKAHQLGMKDDEELVRRLWNIRLEQTAKLEGLSPHWEDYATLTELGLMDSDKVFQQLLKNYKDFSFLVYIPTPGDNPYCYKTLLDASDTVIFEGAQGILLDKDYGFFPHVTYTDTTTKYAEDFISKVCVAKISSTVTATRLGVTRTYQTRHGAGPFPTEKKLDWIGKETYNDGGFAGNFRTGSLDMVLMDYAVRANGGIDAIALTHVDPIPPNFQYEINIGYSVKGKKKAYGLIPQEKGRLHTRIELPEKEELDSHKHVSNLTTVLGAVTPNYIQTSELLGVIESVTGVPVSIKSFGVSSQHKHFMKPYYYKQFS